MVLGKLVHYGVDAVLISAFLAGVRRSTGLTYVSHLPPMPPPPPYAPLRNELHPPMILLCFWVPEFRGLEWESKELTANSIPGPAWGSVRPSVNSETFNDQPGVKKWLDNYLWVGEWTMDTSVAVLSSSSWFERRR